MEALELAWHASVREMPHVNGFSYPVFEWSYGMKEGMRGGEVRVWSLQKSFSHINRREGHEYTTDADGALAWAEEMGWGEPPHFIEVLAALQDMPTPSDPEAAVAGFDALKAQWEKLV